MVTKYWKISLEGIDPSTTIENEYYGAYGSLLHDLFPHAGPYLYAPTLKPRVPNEAKHILWIVEKMQTLHPKRAPIFFLDMKPPGHLNNNDLRAVADQEMRERFLELAHLPPP